MGQRELQRNVSSFELGATVGLGVSFRAGENTSFVVEGAYYRGLTPVFTELSAINTSAVNVTAGIGLVL